MELKDFKKSDTVYFNGEEMQVVRKVKACVATDGRDLLRLKAVDPYAEIQQVWCDVEDLM